MLFLALEKGPMGKKRAEDIEIPVLQ